MKEDVWFSWVGAGGPRGPWQHLRVLSLSGTEEMSNLFSFELELVINADAPDVVVSELVGASASIRIATGTQPAFRLVHGIVAAAEEVADVDQGSRYRVTLRPHVLLATMMKKCAIHLDKTLVQIIEDTLGRRRCGAALEPSSGEPAEDDGDLAVYRAPRATFAWRCIDQARIGDSEARPYCVQYEESDFDFVCRLLEEEGIAYHFEHTPAEAILVLSDFDAGRRVIPVDEPLGANIDGRQIGSWRVGRRVRPQSVSLTAYNWKKPELDLLATAKTGATEFHTHEHSQRYEHSKATGEALAQKRMERLDTEREWSTGVGQCRLLGAGTVFTLDHPQSKFSGKYLVTRITHHVTQGAGADEKGEDGYRSQVECMRCGSAGAEAESGFRPALRTPRPHILGSQTAVVTADPTGPDAEIHVGGPEDVGCVRLRFHWDLDAERREGEPSSCWVRVSHMFAGANHGAVWHPRVGDEVVVDFLDGDPDQPIVTGRVYNGLRKPAENPTARPTFSCFKSLTSPHDGNFNMLSFEDKAGDEEIFLHAARDWNTNVKRSANTSIGLNDDIHVKGDQTVTVDGNQTVVVGATQDTSAGKIKVYSNSTMEVNAAASLTETSPAITIAASATLVETAPTITIAAGAALTETAPLITIGAAASLIQYAPEVTVTGDASIKASAPSTSITGDAIVSINGATVAVTGDTITVMGSGSITVSAPTVNVTSPGTVNVAGGEIVMNAGNIDMNC